MKNMTHDTEMENRLAKELAARSLAQSELKALKRCHEDDTADIKALEAEVEALAKNFDADGTYAVLLDGEMQQIVEENVALKAKLAASTASMACWEGGGLAGEMMEAEGSLQEEVDRLRGDNKVLLPCPL